MFVVMALGTVSHDYRLIMPSAFPKALKEGTCAQVQNSFVHIGKLCSFERNKALMSIM